MFELHKLSCNQPLREDKALHYPYLLAFEPTFVEIRHVETGQLTQVIQGSNVRCLFADTPPSNSNVPHNAYPSTHSQYGMAQQYGGRNPSLSQNQYGASQYPASYGPGFNAGRDEIIMVMDDSVVALRRTIPVDAASMVSR
jgi:RHO1 GDP-GTP exchange protein 1/2